MKVYYGWTKLNKVKKHEAISVIYENCFVPERSEWSRKAAQKTVYVRNQTKEEEKDAMYCNRVYTEYSILLDSKEVGGSLENALNINYEADKNNVSKAEREKIREALKREFLATHKHYREYGYQLSLEF